MQLFERTKRKPTINLTPLIDILFLLIIFFVVSSRIIGNEGIGLLLPDSNQGRQQPLSLPVLTMTADQQFLLNDTLVPKDNLEAALKGLQNVPNTLILKIDERVPHGTVIALMDLVHAAGFQKIVFGTELQSSPPSP